MSQYFSIHPDNPQHRLIAQAAEIVRRGGVIVYPTDSVYAIGCHIGDKHALERVRNIRRVDKNHNFTLLCRDLSELANYARVDNSDFRILKAQHSRAVYLYPAGHIRSAQAADAPQAQDRWHTRARQPNCSGSA